MFAALAPARRVLIAGAGGGFDVYAGLPLALALWAGNVRPQTRSPCMRLLLTGASGQLGSYVLREIGKAGI